ncbi:hypothetical protein D3C73_1103110 [compost metagenome]
MPGFVGEARLGQLDVPVALVHQVVGVTEAQGVVGLAEGHGLLAGGRQFAQHRVLARRHQQLGQVTGRGHVLRRQAGRLDVAGVRHAQAASFGVHCLDESRVAPWIVVGQGGGGAVFRRHQGNEQGFAAVELATQAHARVHAFHVRVISDGHGEHLIHGQLGVQHHHRGHQLGHRGNRHHAVGVARIQLLVGIEVDQQGAAGSQMQL